jgi:hypothetical protein
MTISKLSIKELRERINNGEIQDPLVFLESIMSGQDPRKFSKIYSMIMEIEDFTGGDIGVEDWNSLVDYAIGNCKYAEVSISESTSASKTLAEYIHPKRKQIEQIIMEGNTNPSNHPLTVDEIELFKERFNDEF